MHFTNGETEVRSGEAVYLGYSLNTGLLWVGCAREPQRGVLRDSVSWSDGRSFAHGLGSHHSPSSRVHNPLPPHARFLGKSFCLHHILISSAGQMVHTWPPSEWLPIGMYEGLSCQLRIWGFIGLVSKWCLTLQMLLIEHSTASPSQMWGVCYSYPLSGILSEGSYFTHLLPPCWGAEEPWKVLDKGVI